MDLGEHKILFVPSKTGVSVSSFLWKAYNQILLAVVSSAAMNIGVPVSLGITVLSRYMPRSRIVGSCDISILSFLRHLHAVPIYIPSNSVGGLPLLYILSGIRYL